MGNFPEREKEYTPYKKFLKNVKNAKEGKQKVVLLSTGGFNPCHHMHIRMFELAKAHLEKLDFEVVGAFISPSHDNYLFSKLRNRKAFHNPTIRGEILRLEIEESGDSDWLWVDYWESKACTEFVGHSDVLYTLHDFLLEILGEKVERSKDTKSKSCEQQHTIRTMYLGGRDLWLRCKGHDWLQTPKHGFVMIEREDTSVTSSKAHKQLYERLMQNIGPHLFIVQNPEEEKMGYTSTVLRKMIREKRFDEISEDFLCKRAVRYIKDNNISWEEATLKTC